MSLPDNDHLRNDVSASSDDPSSFRDPDDERTRQAALRWMPFWFLLSGFGIALLNNGDLLGAVFHVAASIAFLVLVHKWCGADARLHGQSLWQYFVVMLVVCPGPLLVVPIHLLRSRGVRGLLSILIAAGYLTVLIGVEVLGLFAGLWLAGKSVPS